MCGYLDSVISPPSSPVQELEKVDGIDLSDRKTVGVVLRSERVLLGPSQFRLFILPATRTFTVAFKRIHWILVSSNLVISVSLECLTEQRIPRHPIKIHNSLFPPPQDPSTVNPFRLNRLRRPRDDIGRSEWRSHVLRLQVLELRLRKTDPRKDFGTSRQDRSLLPGSHGPRTVSGVRQESDIDRPAPHICGVEGVGNPH